jgi:hypothetical protein
MGKPNVAMSAMLTCTFGAAPSSLVVLPTSRVLVEGKPAGNIEAAAPVVNIPPFGMCMSLANPTVAAATAAALGVLTPMPCVPVTEAWLPMSPTTLVGGAPVLVAGSQCLCAWGGVIQVTDPGSTKTLS